MYIFRPSLAFPFSVAFAINPFTLGCSFVLYGQYRSMLPCKRFRASEERKSETHPGTFNLGVDHVTSIVRFLPFKERVVNRRVSKVFAKAGKRQTLLKRL